MDAAMYRSLVAVESAPAVLPSAPERAVARTYPGAPQNDDSIELERLQRPVTTPAESGAATLGEHQVEDLGLSRPLSPVNDNASDGVEIMQGVWDPYMNRFRLLSICLMNFGNGLNDSAPGALIPYMEKYYSVGYGVVSLIFIGNALGFVIAALFLDSLRERLGRARTLALGQILIAAGYVPVVSGAPFPVVVVSFFLVGFGISVNVALGNLFCGGLRNATTVLGVMHGGYGVGGTIGPLVATAVVAVADAPWNRYYFLTLGLTVFNAAFAAWAFRGYEAEARASQPLVAGTDSSETDSRARLSGMFTALSSRVVALGALFIFAYQGAEVSISGWVISFLIAARHGDPSSVGYVTAGFWAGITLGRFALSAPAHRLGEKAAVYGAVAGAAAFQLLVWWVPNVVGDAAAVAVVGLLLGPVYPCAAAVFMRCLSRRERLNGLSVISAFGSSGGAAAPFTTGILAQAVGTFVLHPIVVGLCAVMLICWYGLPTPRKRTE